MSKSAPTSPSGAFREPDLFKSRKLQFNSTVDTEADSDSDSQEPASPKAAFSFPLYHFKGDYEGDECSALEALPLTEVIFEPCGKRGRDEDFKEPQEHEAGSFNPKYYKSDSAQSLNNRVPSSIVFLKAYEEGALFFPAPSSPEVLHSSSSSASASPSDCGSPALADSPASPFPQVLEVLPESKECSDEELSLEARVAQRESGTAPRWEWENEDDLCKSFSGTVISHEALKLSFVHAAAAPVEAAGEAMQFGAD